MRTAGAKPQGLHWPQNIKPAARALLNSHQTLPTKRRTEDTGSQCEAHRTCPLGTLATESPETANSTALGQGEGAHHRGRTQKKTAASSWRLSGSRRGRGHQAENPPPQPRPPAWSPPSPVSPFKPEGLIRPQLSQSNRDNTHPLLEDGNRQLSQRPEPDHSAGRTVRTQEGECPDHGNCPTSGQLAQLVRVPRWESWQTRASEHHSCVQRWRRKHQQQRG